MRMRFAFGVGVMLSLLCPNKVVADTIMAADGSTAGVQAALDTATSGDTVVIPAGTFSFAGSVTLPAGISLVGAGATVTTLAKTGGSAEALVVVECIDQPFEIRGISFVGIDDPTSGIMDKGVRVLGDCQDFRITDCTFEHFGEAAIYLRGNMRGVIDHSRFVDIYRPAIDNYGYGVVVYGDGEPSWIRPLDLGGENAVFVEDSYFEYNRHAIASNNGSRYVFRYNEIVNNVPTYQAIDAHGFEYGSPRGSRSYEIYNNTVDNAEACWAGVAIRGGDGVIFDNEAIRGTTNAILLMNGSGSGCYPCQDQIRELHIWGNTNSGDPVCAAVRGGYESVLQEDRDFFCHARPGYAPFAYPHPLTGSGPSPDAGTADAGTGDGGTSDSGVVDGGLSTRDGGAMDASGTDAAIDVGTGRARVAGGCCRVSTAGTPAPLELALTVTLLAALGRRRRRPRRNDR